MDTLQVPETLEIPSPTPFDLNPEIVADYLMTALFRKQPAMLHAEFCNGIGKWFIRSGIGDECVAESKSSAEFRAVLARFGAHYMDSQLYGGHTRHTLEQLGKKYACRFFMSNDNWTGYWIKVYSHSM